MTVRYVRNFKRCGAFIEAVTSEKLKMTIKKIITQLATVTEFFIAYL
jgi:hypothetical protein